MAKYINGKYILAFRGEFIKHKKYTIYELNEFTTPDEDDEKDEWEVEFKEELYKQAEKTIIEILGKKEKYTVEDAARYFQRKYMAQRIPYEYAWWYQDPSYEENFVPWTPTVDPGRLEPFDYNPETSQEKNITLVVDTIFNPEIRRRYPKIEEYEQSLKSIYVEDVERASIRTNEDFQDMDENLREIILQSRQSHLERKKKRLQNDELGHSNTIIVIGYIEEHVINSMHIECDSNTALEEELHYEFWYFYNHS